MIKKNYNSNTLYSLTLLKRITIVILLYHQKKNCKKKFKKDCKKKFKKDCKKKFKKDCEEELLVKYYDYVLIGDHFINRYVCYYYCYYYYCCYMKFIFCFTVILQSILCNIVKMFKSLEVSTGCCKIHCLITNDIGKILRKSYNRKRNRNNSA